MSTTISAYNYKFSLDANDFANGARLTKTELGMVNQALRESQTEQDKAQIRFNALAKAMMTNKVTTEEAARAYEHLAATTPEAIAAQKRHSEAMADGKRIMDAHKPAVVAYREEVAKLNGLLKMGAIDQRAHAAEVAKSRGSLAAKAIGVAGIPVIGDLVEKGVAGAQIHPAMAAFAVGAAVGREAVHSFREEAEKIETVSKASRRLGIATEDVIVFSKAAKQSGADFADVEKALVKMNRTIGDGALGKQAQIQMFDTLGLSAKELQALRPEEAFFKINAALRELPDGYVKSTIQAQVYGEEASKINAVVDLTAASFAKMREAADAKGQTFSNEDAERMHEATLAMDKLGSVFKTIKQNAAIAASDGVMVFVTAINEAINGVQKLDAAEAAAEKRRLGAGKDTTKGDRSRNIGELGGIAVDFVSLLFTRGHSDEEESPWRRAVARIGREVAADQQRLREGFSALDKSGNAEYDKSKEEWYQALKLLNAARARGDVAEVERQKRAVQELNAIIEQMDKTPRKLSTEQDAEEAKQKERGIKQLQDQLALLKELNSGAAATTAEAKAMQDARAVGQEAMGQEIVAQLKLRKEQEANDKLKEEAARKQEALTQRSKDFIETLKEQQRLRELTGGHLENAAKQMEVFQMQAQGLTGEPLAQAMAAAKAEDARKAREDMGKQIDQALQQGQTPAEKYEAEIRKLLEWQRAGADVVKIQRLMDAAAKSYFATQKEGQSEGIEGAEATEQNLLRLQRRDREQFDAAARQKAEQSAVEQRIRGQMGIATPEDQVGWKQPAPAPQLPEMNAPIGMTWTPPPAFANRAAFGAQELGLPQIRTEVPIGMTWKQPAPAPELQKPGWLLAQQSILDHPTAQPDETWPLFNRRFEEEAARAKEREASQAAAMAPEYNPWGAIPGDAIPAQIGVDVVPHAPESDQKINDLLERVAVAVEATATAAGIAARREPVKLEEIASF